MKKATFLSVVLQLLPTIAIAKARGDALPVSIQYLRTGRENEAEAIHLGQAEVENTNPCVLGMRRELEDYAAREDMLKASHEVIKKLDMPALKPLLTLRFMNESVDLRYDAFAPAEKNQNGKVLKEEKLVYRKSVPVSDFPGSWQERLHGGKCHIPATRVQALVDELREADRYAACAARKVSLLEGSAKISHYLHNYVPVAWIDDARARLSEKQKPVGDLLREDTTVYRQGSTYRECAKSLKLLEEEAGNTLRVINEVRTSRKMTDVPAKEISNLGKLLGAS